VGQRRNLVLQRRRQGFLVLGLGCIESFLQ
jgi:hypothetical protein